MPTSAGQEDANANSTTAARHLATLVANLRLLVAIEWLAAAQALDLRMQMQPDVRLGRGTAVAFAGIRRVVPFLTEDVPLHGYVARVADMLKDRALIREVEGMAG